MKKHFLFPNSFKVVGCIIAISAFTLLLGFIFSPNASFLAWMDASFPFFALLGNEMDLYTFCFWTKSSFLSTILPVLITIGFLFIAFAREKVEDEYILKLREKSLVWAVILYNLVFVLGPLFIYGSSYIVFLQLSFYIVLIFYILRFKYELYRLRKSLGHEE